jgi:hypothetical protein
LFDFAGPSAKRFFCHQYGRGGFHSAGAAFAQVFCLGFIRLYRSALSRRAARIDIADLPLQQPEFLETSSKEPDDYR